MNYQIQNAEILDLEVQEVIKNAATASIQFLGLDSREQKNKA